jgi:hypothetical protein
MVNSLCRAFCIRKTLFKNLTYRLFLVQFIVWMHYEPNIYYHTNKIQIAGLGVQWY